MYPTFDVMLDGIAAAVENYLLPELTSATARSQALAIVQDIAIIRDQLQHAGPSLAAQNRDARALITSIDATLSTTRHPLDATTSATLQAAIAAQCARAYPPADGTLDSLIAENNDWRSLYCRLIAALCGGPEIEEFPAFDAWRGQARGLWMDGYGISNSYRRTPTKD